MPSQQQLWGNPYVKSEISDHLPVTARIEAARTFPPSRLRLPMWLIKHNEYQHEFPGQLQSNSIFFDTLSGVDIVELVKHLAHESAKVTKRKLRTIGADTLEEKAHWATRWLRAHRSGAHRSVGEAEQAFPLLASCAGIPCKVHDLLRCTMNELLSKEFEDALHEPDLP